MKGFELIYNNQIVTASIERGVISIILSKIDDAIRVDFVGLDSNTNQHLTWFKSTVNESDKIAIKVIDVNQVAEVIEFKPNSRDSFENKLIEYKGLKKYLEKEGLIKKEE
ncbi:MAG TPA: hypothetical protein GX717_08105 [Clostridiaceae bacterium]|jgi:hypothetical protein|nr:hypothetical protein [Clostridiaceae bacterium]